MNSMTRGPLSPGVYWRRRIFVLLLALTLVFVFASLLGVGSDGSSDDDGVARQAAADPKRSAKEPTRSPTATRSGQGTGKGTGKGKKGPTSGPTSEAPPALAEPTGPCVDGDILIAPSVEEAVAGREVMVVLQLRTLMAEACTWRVSSSHVTLKIYSGSDDIWSSLECPSAVPVQDVVVRRAVTATIGVVWDARRSDDSCSALTDWALPGFYHVAAAALGGEPSDVQFELAAPSPEVITESPEPEQDEGKKGRKGNKQRRDR
ncbi:MAG: hypothetical protein WKF79_15660 [Nocardioides sp.]